MADEVYTLDTPAVSPLWSCLGTVPRQVLASINPVLQCGWSPRICRSCRTSTIVILIRVAISTNRVSLHFVCPAYCGGGLPLRIASLLIVNLDLAVRWKEGQNWGGTSWTTYDLGAIYISHTFEAETYVTLLRVFYNFLTYRIVYHLCIATYLTPSELCFVFHISKIISLKS